MVLLTLDVVYHGSGMMMLPMMMLPLPCVLCLHMKPPSKSAGSSVFMLRFHGDCIAGWWGREFRLRTHATCPVGRREEPQMIAAPAKPCNADEVGDIVSTAVWGCQTYTSQVFSGQTDHVLILLEILSSSVQLQRLRILEREIYHPSFNRSMVPLWLCEQAIAAVSWCCCNVMDVHGSAPHISMTYPTCCSWCSKACWSKTFKASKKSSPLVPPRHWQIYTCVMCILTCLCDRYRYR
jgi:hypothetical protein